MARVVLPASDTDRMTVAKALGVADPGALAKLAGSWWQQATASPAELRKSLDEAVEILQFEVTRLDADRKRVATAVLVLKALEGVGQERDRDRAAEAEISRLTALSKTVTNRDQAKFYRERAEALSNARPTPAAVAELRKVADERRRRASVLTNADEALATIQAASAAEFRAGILEKQLEAIGAAGQSGTRSNTVFAAMAAQCRDIHTRISNVHELGGNAVAHHLEIDTLTKSSSDIDRWMSLSADLAAVPARLTELESTPLSVGPMRVVPAHISKTYADDEDPDLVKAARYRRTAAGVHSRDQATAYVALAEQLEEQVRQKGANR